MATNPAGNGPPSIVLRDVNKWYGEFHVRSVSGQLVRLLIGIGE